VLKPISSIPLLVRVAPGALSHEDEVAVDGAWTASVAAHPSLFDGPITCVRSISDSTIEVYPSSYRFWHAQFHGSVDLGLSVLAVSGVIHVAGGLLMCRRAGNVSQSADQWEFAPSGGVVLGDARSDEGVLLHQLLSEAREELNLEPSDLQSPRALALITDDEVGVTDVVIEFRSDLSAEEFAIRWSARSSDEYRDFTIVRNDAVPSSNVAASTSLVLEALSRRGGV